MESTPLRESKHCILIADDDDDDQMMMKSAFEDTGFDGTVCSVSNGEALLEFLRNIGTNDACPKPHLILLDLNMPRKDGREVLREIRKNQLLARIPVVVYSTSSNPADVAFCYDHGANSFISKPSSYETLMKIAALLQEYWLRTVLLPE
jgi:CheY-like chemotaxis protein